MSEAELEKSPKEIMNYLERAIVNGWYYGLERSDFPPWADAYETLEEIDDFTDHYERFGSEVNFIDFLSRLSGIDYDTFKQMWNKLSEKQRAEVIDVATYNIALIGLKNLFEWIAEKLSTEKYKEARAKVLQAVKDYLNGKMNEMDLMIKIAEILWPTEKDKEESGYEYDDFLRAEGLVEYYIGSKDFKKLIKKYLLERLEKLE